MEKQSAKIFFDTSDPSNLGWAYSVMTRDHHMSGPLPQRRRDARLPSLRRALARELEGARVEIPPVSQWVPVEHDGPGWAA